MRLITKIRYCPYCGTELLEELEDGGWTNCALCGFVYIEFIKEIKPDAK